MLQLGNYLLYEGRYAKVKGLHHEEILLELPDKTLMSVSENEIRFIELKSDVLLSLVDQERGDKVFTLQSEKIHLLHKRQDYLINLRGKRFVLHGYLYDDISIWQFLTVFSLHYLHQLQNVIQILNPDVLLELS